MTVKGEKMTNQGEMTRVEPVEQVVGMKFWQFPDFASPEGDEVTERNLVYDDARIVGVGKELIMEGVYVWYGKFHVRSSDPLPVRMLGSHIQMNFSLQSVTTYFSEASTKPFVKFRSQQHNLFLLPQKDMQIQWRPQEDVEVFAINLSTDFFFNNLPKTHPLYAHFQKGIRSLLPAFMSWRNMPVTSRMISSLFEILNCTYSNYQKGLFIKAKVIELLALQFEQYEQLPAPDITIALKESDVEKMHLARRILTENLDKSWSLKDLAHHIGTNEFSLKKHFKEVFGKPVFSYLHDLRMEASMQLLQQPGTRISEISQKTGYKNPTHFTAAFKKYYQVLPNKIRLGMLNLVHFVGYVSQLCAEFAEGISLAEVAPL
ncbi:HTH-type transcriptional activator RhaR [Dyadobacter sp. CECT 9623]|uniref:HTH-type transcriptional activator RhaR n=2 Tax=Dyadobacter linearis TaxID=2823330 RepID=A0ABM8UL05_9BACT|nr:HTH-type transcriptional activator RhaR [Dyadobacter sp. CECT 9623]